jgi:hypothetical protein
VEKSSSQNGSNSVIFKKLTKETKTPIRRKFAQSGHPVTVMKSVFFVAQFSNALQDLINMYAHYIGKASKLKVSNLQINKFSLKIIKFLISI